MTPAQDTCGSCKNLLEISRYYSLLTLMWKTALAYPWPGPALNFNHSLRIWWLAERRVFVIKFDKTSPLGKLVHKHLQRVMQAWCTAFSTTNPASTGRTTQDLKWLRLCITMISPSEQYSFSTRYAKGSGDRLLLLLNLDWNYCFQDNDSTQGFCQQ